MTNMQVSVESTGSLERRMEVSVPKEQIEQAIDERLKKVSRTAKLKGFRPGKAPIKVIKQQFGAQVRQEVLGDVLQKSFGEAVRQQNLRVAGYPRFEPKPAEGNQVEFSATFEIYPEVSLGDLAGVQVERPVVSVDEAEIDKTVEILRKQRTHYREVEREARNGDTITIDYQGTINGEAFEGGSGTVEIQPGGTCTILPDSSSNTSVGQD